MTNPVAASAEFDFIQRHLIPADSTKVRYCMRKAAEMSERENLLMQHFFPVPFVVMAIALSFFNVLSYLLQIPFLFILSIVRLAPLRLATDPTISFINVARSLLFVAMGPPLIVAGLVFPEDVMSRFAPDSIICGEERLLNENQALKQKIKALEEKIKQDQKLIEAQAAVIQRST